MNSEHSHTTTELSRLDDDIRIVSRFQAVRVCRAALSILLIALELFLACCGSSSVPALNILLFANLAPWLLEEVLSSRQEAKGTGGAPPPAASLPYLRKHYRYSRLRFTAETVSYFLTCLLLLLWQRRSFDGSDTAAWLRNAPVLLLSVIVLLRLAAPYYLAWRIRRRLLYGGIK